MKKLKTAPDARLQAERRRVGAVERKEPLRRRLLVALGEGEATWKELTGEVGGSGEAASRKLRDLLEAGLVTVVQDSDDGRRRIYSLTRGGRAELGRHVAFGRREKVPAPPSSAEEVEFLWEALGGARTMRRRSHRLREATERLEDIGAQAEELGASDLALEALAELAITQRQDRQLRKRKASLKRLAELASGVGDVEPRLVHPAIAHLEYERGKEADFGATDVAALGRHLGTASSLFDALAKDRPKAEAKLWMSRRAWSSVALANNYREQSRYDDSIRNAASGLSMFNSLDDDYGRMQCWYLFGFCLRLLRRFDVAWTCLQHAQTLATDGGRSFERGAAYCLVQMGEVRRCQGRTDEARALLEDGFERADRLYLDVAMAFATSGMGAVQYQDGDLELSKATLERAQGVFDLGDHMEGTALNARRQATVARCLSSAGTPPTESKVKELIKQAQGIYLALNSPAGVAACEIERGWMRTISPRCGSVDAVVDRLTRILDRSDERQTVERDPWVPRVLRDFSKEVGGTLEKEAKRILTQARLRIEEEGEEGMQSVSAVADGLAQEREDKPSTKVVEMGGESRRKRAPLELVAA